jgi:DNA-binding transcriptional ArsR family regulator
MLKTKLLQGDEEISAYLHKTRMSILRLLRHRPATASQIAKELGVHPANLTRHFRILQKAGLIVLAETRDTGRNLEKYYETVAESFLVTSDASGLKEPHKIALQYALSDLAEAIPSLPAKEEAPVYAMVQGALIPEEKIDALRRAIDALIASFAAAGSERGLPYHLNVSLYPAPAFGEQGELITLKSGEETA